MHFIVSAVTNSYEIVANVIQTKQLVHQDYLYGSEDQAFNPNCFLFNVSYNN